MFDTLKKTINLASYSEIVQLKFSSSLKFFFLYFLVYAVVATCVSVPRLFPLKSMILGLPAKLEQLYPEELEIKLQKGEISTNVPEPYYIPLEKVLGDKPAETPTPPSEITNFIVIDTNANVEDFPGYKTVILLTKRNIVTLDDNGGYKVNELTSSENITINRQVVKTLISTISPFLRYLFPALIFCILLGLSVFYPSGKMTYLLFFALIGLLVAKLMSVKLTFGKIYQIGLHLILIPTTIGSIAVLAGYPILFPFLQTIVMTVLLIIALSGIKRRALVLPAAPISPEAPKQ